MDAHGAFRIEPLPCFWLPEPETWNPLVVNSTVRHVLESLGRHHFVRVLMLATAYTWMDVGHCLEQTKG